MTVVSQLWIRCSSDPRVSRPLGVVLSPRLKHYPTILPKLRSGSDLVIELECTVIVPADRAESLATELRQILRELGLGEAVRVEEVSLTNSDS